MPGLGDQHKATTNPFEEVRPHVSEYTAQEIATLSSRLEKQLGPEYISTRPGASGQRVPYLAADKAINLANEVFGFNGWSSCIKEIQLDFIEESQSTGKVSLGLSVIVRVTLRDGTYHEDIGYGHIENCKGKAAAFEKAKKEGTTDGMKRALRSFGNILGNCVYDKDYVAKVSKIRVAPSKWDPVNLHRHADYAPVKKEPVILQSENGVQIKNENAEDNATGATEPEDEFATDDFDEVDFSVSHEFDPSDEPIKRLAPVDSRVRSSSDAVATGSRNPIGQRHPRSSESDPQARFAKANSSSSAKQSDQGARDPAYLQQATHQDLKPVKQNTLPPFVPSILHDAQAGAQQRPQRAEQKDNPACPHGPSSFGTPPPAAFTSVSCSPPLGFFTARAAETIQSASGIPPQAPSFNPHLESPSIRKTAGVDHTKTKPVARELVGAPPPPAVSSASRPNFVNPQVDKGRRVGMPGGVASPLANRSSYKPPQMKRPADGTTIQSVFQVHGEKVRMISLLMIFARQSRPALGDVTSTTVNLAPDAGAGGDVKRQRTHDPLLPAPG
ncbi:MAG: hypothetical protein Q9204_000246 [Flavoplaca sp. TL-2023a]